ncbi:MAG: ABC transporter permease subunit [Sphaerochaetaceae bacterium]|jgi:arabinogalactan oligomer/maltooligosaccharide transport system permease protein|nr:ABC transporter permease subunit [Sphaerochaetaceae bacterium]MDD3163484.1 ABC transporter permease subunit [Sphaerochaetaceae bacterium]MDD4007460.1 ABC transporter permease subunit [Sphaerochaetaceae bacterium]MDD4396611.1 ABC transporter permease subunit [Sphaerochaetaceae bacterium]
MKNSNQPMMKERFYPVRHIVLLALAIFWLIPIVWLLLCSFSTSNSMSISHFFPEKLSLIQYKNLLFKTDAANQFPRWMLNTFLIAAFNCLISTFFVLQVAYAMSKMRFRARKGLMNIGMILGLFPGFLSMIAVYFIMKTFNLTNSHIGMIIVYSASSGMGYLIAKGFFDTIPNSMCEAAKIDGASQNSIFFRIIIPMSKPIIVYTSISAFLAPWVDFIFAKIMLNSGIAKDWTVALGLYGMLDRSRKNLYFGQFCAGGVLVSIPISILFVVMQKFYVEGITSGSAKG